MTTILLSVPAHASTYADLSGDALRAAVTAWGSYLEERLTAVGYEVSVEVTREARMYGFSVQDDGAEADAIEAAASRIGDAWMGLSDEERAAYGCPA